MTLVPCCSSVHGWFCCVQFFCSELFPPIALQQLRQRNQMTHFKSGIASYESRTGFDFEYIAGVIQISCG
jgi:hypothetical protein